MTLPATGSTGSAAAGNLAPAAAQQPGFSVIVLTRDNRDEIAGLHQEVLAALAAWSQPYELIYVDDGSSDGTWAELVRISRSDPRVKAARMRSSFGEASALDAGVQMATGSVLLYFTCRVRIKPADALNLLRQIEAGEDVVIGVRHPRRDSGLNRVVSRLFNGLTNRMTKLHLHDVNSGVLALRREVLDHVPYYGTLNAFLPVLAHRQGYRIAEGMVEQLPGHFAQSLYPKNYLRRTLDLVSVLFLSKYSKKPLHFLGFIGALFTLTGAAINLYLFIYRILGFGGIAGKPMLLLGAILFIIGIQMISIGLLAEMIIFTHAKEIKDYNIEEIIN
ncbi:MAG TPA: glycosyltransferase [bacterium]|nr:glycosyltransferase [bacterium]HPR87817.1 glycosyltransferase [bacterium]